MAGSTNQLISAGNLVALTLRSRKMQQICRQHVQLQGAKLLSWHLNPPCWSILCRFIHNFGSFIPKFQVPWRRLGKSRGTYNLQFTLLVAIMRLWWFVSTDTSRKVGEWVEWIVFLWWYDAYKPTRIMRFSPFTLGTYFSIWSYWDLTEIQWD